MKAQLVELHYVLVLISLTYGQSLRLNGSSSFAVLGQPFDWECQGQAYPGAVSGISFNLNGTVLCEVPISNFPQNCSVNKVNSRLTCGCHDYNVHRLYMHISESKMADTGSWTCGFEQYSMKSPDVEHYVYYGPGSTVTIDTPKTELNIKAEADIKIKCSASCLPSCKFQWYKDGVLLVNSSKLHVKNAQDKDTGHYLCEASNIVSKNTSGLFIRVLDEPKAPRDLKHVFSTSDTVCLVWRAGDDGGASHVFHLEMAKVPDNTASELNWKHAGDDVEETVNGGPVSSCINDLDPSISYYFQVYASNEHHTGNASLPLQVSTAAPQAAGLSFSSGLGLGLVLGLILVIIGLVLGIVIIIKRGKYKQTDGYSDLTSLVPRND